MRVTQGRRKEDNIQNRVVVILTYFFVDPMLNEYKRFQNDEPEQV